MTNATENLLVRIQKLGKLTPSEAKIAAYLRRHYPKNALESTAEISRNTGTSKATVVRFISRLGYLNYAEFKEQLQENLVNRLESKGSLFTSIKKKIKKSESDFLGMNIAQVVHNLQDTDDGIDRKSFMKAAELLADENRKIFIIGHRISYGPAHILWILLKYLRKNVFLITGQFSEVVEEIEDATSNDVLLTISHRRYSRQTIEISEFFNEVGAKIISLVDTDRNPFLHLADIQMVIPASGLTIFDSTCATLAFIEALVLAVASLLGEKIYKRIDENEKLFKHFKTFLDENDSSRNNPKQQH